MEIPPPLTPGCDPRRTGALSMRSLHPRKAGLFSFFFSPSSIVFLFLPAPQSLGLPSLLELRSACAQARGVALAVAVVAAWEGRAWGSAGARVPRTLHPRWIPAAPADGLSL